MPTKPQVGGWRVPQWLARYVSYGTEGLTGPELRQRRTLNVVSALIPMSGLSYASLYLTVDPQGLWPAALAVSLFCLFLFWPFIAARNLSVAWLFGASLAVLVQAILV